MAVIHEYFALRGRQAGREYYSIMCPLKDLTILFPIEYEEIPVELRAQRTLNKTRVPDISRYLTVNQDNYIFSSITASIDGNFEFRPANIEGDKQRGVGFLRIPADETRLLINDGQHRRAAIEEALKETPEIGSETISVVFFVDTGLERSQQMFVDLNKHAVKPATSLSITYDQRDALSGLSRTIVEEVDVFRNLTEMEKSSISNRSCKLFTISAIHKATKVLLNKNKKYDFVNRNELNYAIDYWTHVCENMQDWKLAAKKDVATHELRKEYIHSHGLAMHALGKVGAAVAEKEELDFRKILTALKDIDWRRSNAALWEGRAMKAGAIQKGNVYITLTTNKIKQDLGLPLTDDELKMEKEFLRSI